MNRGVQVYQFARLCNKWVHMEWLRNTEPYSHSVLRVWNLKLKCTLDRFFRRFLREYMPVPLSQLLTVPSAPPSTVTCDFASVFSWPSFLSVCLCYHAAFFLKYLFIYLTALSLCCNTWIFIVSCGGFHHGPWTPWLWCTGSVVVACGLSCSKACCILVPWPGVEPMSPALQSGFLTTGPPGKSPLCILSRWGFSSLKKFFFLVEPQGLSHKGLSQLLDRGLNSGPCSASAES